MSYLITYLLNLFDLAATTYWVNRFSLEVEANPIGRWLFSTGLVYPVKIVGIAALLYALRLCIKKAPGMEWTSRLMLAVYSCLTVRHVVLAVWVAIITKGA